MPLQPSTTPSHVLTVSQQNYGLTVEENNWDLALAYAAVSVTPNSVTSSTTSNGTANLSISNVTTATATVSGTLTANHIHGNLAGAVYAHVRAGETLAKGDPVYVSGFHGSGSTLIAEVSKADASNAAKMPAVGIMDAIVTQHQNGHMVVLGTITEFNTAAYAINAELYVGVGGGMVATPPSDRAQPIARVERSNTNNGAIIVTIGDLSATNATNNTLVRRDATGTAKFSGLAIPSFTSGNVVTVTTAGAFANTSRSGIDSRSSFPNTDVTNATSLAIADRIVKRDGIGDIAVSGLIANTISVGDIDASGYVMAGGFESPAITLTDSVYLDALTYVFGAGADQALKDALGITFSNITDSESGTAYLNLSTLALSEPIVSGLQPKLVFTANPTAVGDGQQILWQWYDGTTTTTTASISSEATGSTTDKLIFQTTAGGALGTSLDLTNTLATFSGVVSSFGSTYQTGSTFTYNGSSAATHRTALGLDTLFNGKANLAGGNTFTGAQSINGTVTTSDKVSIDSTSAVTNPKLLITASTASGSDDNSPLVIKGSGINRTCSINLRTTGGSGELYNAWVAGRSGGGISINNMLSVTNGTGGPLSGSTTFIVLSTGNVGVGTTTPTSSFSRTLQITGDGSSAISLSNTAATKKYSFGLTSTNSLGFYDETASAYRLSILTTGEVGIGTTTPSTKAALDITSTTKGFLPPRMATTQRDVITSVPAGLVIYNTTTNNLNTYNGSAWVELVDSADLGTGIPTFLADPSSENLANALGDTIGTGPFILQDAATLTGPNLEDPIISGSAAFTSTTRPTSAGTGTPLSSSILSYSDFTNYIQQRVNTAILIPTFATSRTSSGGSLVQSRGYSELTLLVTNSAAINLQFDSCVLLQTTSASLSFDKRMIFCINIFEESLATNNQLFIQLGRNNFPATFSQLSEKGIGFGMSGSSLTPFVHNGSVLTSGSAVTKGTYSKIIMDFIPASGLYLYGLNNSTMAIDLLSSVTTNLPSGLENRAKGGLEIMHFNNGTGAAGKVTFSNPQFSFL